MNQGIETAPVRSSAVNGGSSERKPTGKGLSELSSQLRKLQATNHSQAAEIERLERQVRILADTKGVSITDVRSSLLEACQGEAFHELQNQVAVLQAKLDAAALSNKGKKSISFDKEAADRTIADLQLRAGELEEIESSLRAEVTSLYKSLKEQTSKATRLESVCAEQEERLAKNEEREKLNRQVSTRLVLKAEADADKEITAQKVEIDRLKGRARDAETQLQMEIDKSKILEKELDSREKELQLRTEQFNSRFKFQDERIIDLEQQLSSLYTAYEMESEDRTGEADRRAVLETYLNTADSELARQIHMNDENEQENPSLNQPESPSTPVQHSSIKKDAGVPVQVLLSGWLMKREKNVLGGSWKKRYFGLIQSGDGTCRLSYSEGPGKKVKGTFGCIVAGRSVVRQTKEHSRWPHAFELHINPLDPQSRMLCAAAPGQKCLDKWLSALRKVTEGHDTQMEAALKASTMESALKAPIQGQQSTPTTRDRDMETAIMASIEEQHTANSGSPILSQANSPLPPNVSMGGPPIPLQENSPARPNASMRGSPILSQAYSPAPTTRDRDMETAIMASIEEQHTANSGSPILSQANSHLPPNVSMGGPPIPLQENSPARPNASTRGSPIQSQTYSPATPGVSMGRVQVRSDRKLAVKLAEDMYKSGRM